MVTVPIHCSSTVWRGRRQRRKDAAAQKLSVDVPKARVRSLPKGTTNNSFGGYSRSVRELLSDIGILGKNFLVVGTGLHSDNGPFLSPETAHEAPLPWICRHPGGSVQPGRELPFSH